MSKVKLKYEGFLKALMNYKKLSEEFSELYQMGFDFLEGQYKLEEKTSLLFDLFLESNFTEEGVDWINWFIFENDWGEKDWSKYKIYNNKTKKLEDADPMKAYGAKDEEGNPICYSFESTWNYVEKYLK